MTGSLVYLGPQPERAAALRFARKVRLRRCAAQTVRARRALRSRLASLFKLFGNLTLLGILGVLGDVGRLAAAVGIDMKDAFSLFEHFNPGNAVPQRAKRISAGQYTPPSFEMSMARKDLRLTVEAGRARRADAGDGAGVGEAVG